MAHPWITQRARKCIVAACGFFAIALLTSTPSQANTVVPSKGFVQKTTHAAFVQHVGGVNPAGAHQFTVMLKTQTAEAAATVASYFRHFGMLAEIASNNHSVHVSGTFGASASAANVRFERVKIGNETFTRTTAAPRFPSGIGRLIAATSISPGAKMRALNVRPQALVVGPQLGYGPADYASIYDINPVYASGVDGTGITIDIAACFNIDPADITFFQNFYGLPVKPVHIVHVDGTRDQFGSIPFPDIEPTLDVERVMATAPGARISLYLVPDCFISQFVDMFAKIAADDHAAALSVSYGLPEADYAVFGLGSLITAQNVALQDVANAKITTFAASGDSGSWGDPFSTGLINFLDVLYPASDPNVLSVGGTTTEQTVLGTRLFEYAWGGSGGGVSGIFPITPWQATTPGVASGLFKNLPDVSMNGDPNTGAAEAFLVGIPPPIFSVGGTSASSPTWAGLIALVDQNRRKHGHGFLTNVPAALYSLQGRSAYTDITVGANGYFPARKGFDNATGLGAPDVAKLVTALQ